MKKSPWHIGQRIISPGGIVGTILKIGEPHTAEIADPADPLGGKGEKIISQGIYVRYKNPKTGKFVKGWWAADRCKITKNL